MSIWPSRRRPPQPSKEALDSIIEGNRELAEVQQLRRESETVGAALRKAHEENHIAAALEAAIRRRRTA